MKYKYDALSNYRLRQQIVQFTGPHAYGSVIREENEAGADCRISLQSHHAFTGTLTLL